MLTYLAHSRSFLARGFTLVEMFVVVAVISIITMVMLFNQDKFSSSTLLRSLSYSVALTVRQAQLYGSSVRGFTSGGVTQFAAGYGTYFSNSSLSQFYLFADINGNSVRDSGEDAATSKIGAGYTISKFCGIIAFGSGVMDCYPAGQSGGGTLPDLTMYFKRPTSDATFSTTCSSGCASSYVGAFIEVQSTANRDFRVVKVTSTGQITVCPLNTEPPTATC